MAHPTFSDLGVHVISGFVERLDLFNREIAIASDDEPISIEAPLACSIILHGQSVRLRLIQPQDRIRATFRVIGGRNVANRIEVNTA